jgi:Membrane transport protein MerF
MVTPWSLSYVTPVLAVLLGALGLTAFVAKLDYVLVPHVRSVDRACDLCAGAPAAELRREAPGANLADRRFDHHMPQLRASSDRTNAAGCLLVLLRLQGLWATAQAEARRLLRVLFLWFSSVPGDPGRAVG